MAIKDSDIPPRPAALVRLVQLNPAHRTPEQIAYMLKWLADRCIFKGDNPKADFIIAAREMAKQLMEPQTFGAELCEDEGRDS